MKNLKGLLAVLLVLTMALVLGACGGSKAPAEEEGGYSVTVLDENGDPVVGAMIQLCKDVCVPGVTDAEGTAKFNLPRDTYKVSFLALPAGYIYADDVQEFCFEGGSREMTIILKAAE